MSNDKRLQTSRTFVTNQPQHMDVSGSTGMSSTTSTADGANVVEGAVADVATTGDSAGTLSAKLRGLVKILSDIWDSVNHRIRVDGSGVTQPVSGTVSATQGTSPWVVADNITQVGGTLQTARDWSLDFAKLPSLVGTWGYKAGASGTPALPSNSAILQITAIATSGSGTVTVNGGDSIPIPQNSALVIAPEANLIQPTIVFTATDSYFVEYHT